MGLIPGLIIVFFILNQKGASCSGYLPSSRVVAETLSKEFQFTDAFKQQMAAYHVDENLLRDSIITHGTVDFDRSHAQKQPCPDYLLTYPENDPRFEVTFEKCRETATFKSLKALK